MDFGTIEERFEVDQQNNPVSRLKMADGLAYRMVHFPSKGMTDKAAVFWRHLHIPISSSSSITEIDGEKKRITSVTIGPFHIIWTNGKVSEHRVPPLFPDSRYSDITTMPEDINRFIVLAVHYIAVLNLWGVKKDHGKSGFKPSSR